MDSSNPHDAEEGLLLRGFHLITLRATPGNELGLLRDAALRVERGRITWLGPAAESPSIPKRTRIIEGGGRFLSPGLIDCHTHVIWGGSRVAEWEARQGGASYESLAAAGGGILSTVRATRATDDDALYASARRRLEFALRHGVTGVEIKSGYGLTLEDELRMLRVATELRDSLPLSVSRTLLAAHAVPPEFAGDGDGYLDLIVREILPRAKPLCEAVDVFVETVAFSVRQGERLLRAARELGLGLKIHAEQRSFQGSAAMAAELAAWSADHLEYLDLAGVAVMAAKGTTAVLLPGAFYMLRETRVPPVEQLRAHGVPIAIASDLNPGSSPVASLLMAMNMACVLFGLTPVEAWRGVTSHAARALRWDHELGRLDVGKRADFAIWEIDDPAEVPFGIAHNPCVGVFRGGECIWSEWQG